MSPDTQPRIKEIPFDELSVVQFFRERKDKNGRSWSVEEIKEEEAHLVPIETDSFLGCGDGRLIEASTPQIKQKYIRGPKIFGALGGFAGLLGDASKQGLVKACEILKFHGILPAVHGDNHKGIHGCGQNGVWEKNGYSQMPAMETTREDIKEIAEENGGVSVNHLNDHGEQSLDIILNPSLTAEPDNTRFIINAGTILPILKEQGKTDENILWTMTAETVEGLSDTMRTVRIIR